MNINTLVSTLRENSIEENIIPMEKYMKNNFKFLGIKSVERRELSKGFLRKEKDIINWEEVFYLWELEEREFQYIALDYLKARKKFLKIDDLENLLKLAKKKPWWDTIDLLAPLVGEAIFDFKDKNKLMLDLSKDENMWLKRIAILHQLKFKEDTDEKLLEEIIKNNFGSKEFFINKAIGWILREYSKTNKIWVRKFLDEYKDVLSPLSIREGSKILEKLNS